VSEPNETLVALTADIVSAHVANNSVAVNDLPQLIQNIHGALSGLGTATEEPAPQRREPKVSPRSAIKPDAITCLVCGTKHKMLKRHLSTAHGMTTREYRQEFGLRDDYPMVSPNYSEQRRTLAKSIGLGTKGRGRKAAAPATAATPKTRSPRKHGSPPVPVADSSGAKGG
jgi:predicted transcriptional regulator